MFIRLLLIIAITYAVLTYVLHLTPEQSMFIYAGAVGIVFVAGEIVVSVRS